MLDEMEYFMSNNRRFLQQLCYVASSIVVSGFCYDQKLGVRAMGGQG